MLDYCKLSSLGLFTADQELKGNTARFTRQNPNGNQHGYECPEERDYYPYWHPTDWSDIAVLANDEKDCAFYRDQSFNVKPKGNLCLVLYKYKASWFCLRIGCGDANFETVAGQSYHC